MLAYLHIMKYLKNKALQRRTVTSAEAFIFTRSSFQVRGLRLLERLNSDDIIPMNACGSQRYDTEL